MTGVRPGSDLATSHHWSTTCEPQREAKTRWCTVLLFSLESRICSKAASFFFSTCVNLPQTAHLCRRSAARDRRTRVVGSSSRVRRKRRHFPGFWRRKKKRERSPVSKTSCFKLWLFKQSAVIILPLSRYTPVSLGCWHASASVCHLSSRCLDLAELVPALTEPLVICCPLLDKPKLCRVRSEATVGRSQSTLYEGTLMLSSGPGDKHFTADRLSVQLRVDETNNWRIKCFRIYCNNPRTYIFSRALFWVY